MEPNEEERRLVYGEGMPQQRYYGDDPNDPEYAYMQRRIAEAARGVDPRMLAEQDARIQRGRNFWTGAGLFANVLGNAINVSGTANGAPNMTFNDASQQRMYEMWRQRDRELKADRKAALERYDTLSLQDARLRAEAARQKAKDAKDIYDTAFKFRKADEDWQRNQEARREDAEAARQFQSEEAQKSRNFQASQNRENREHQQTMAETRAQIGRGYNRGAKTIRIGNTDFRAESEAEANSNIAQVYGMVLEAYNEGRDQFSRAAFDGNIDNEYSFINAHINSLYNSNPAFRSRYDEWASQHQRSVSGNYQQGATSSWLDNGQVGRQENNNSWLH